MGNCLFGGLGDVNGGVIKVITSNGGVMELYAPIAASSITNQFPGHSLFRSHDLFWKPLSHYEELLPGQTYYLLNLNNNINPADHGHDHNQDQVVRQGHIRSKSIPTITTSQLPAPYNYRMSLDYQGLGLLRRSYTEASSNFTTSSYRSVKLVISPDQLLDILSQEGSTQELIESVRTVAKCSTPSTTNNGIIGAGSGAPDASAGAALISDQWSLSNSWSASFKKDHALVVDI
ncbi:DUF4228 domain-containing protein [Quillaja saponaria]|uniref:DUF4228 domain-containing protein n=1 Tax=Quillaja saponaria TaxID=32244 RepID=A0AAD7P7K9_QUISA|nr:DUF4228 domain-containing protein [Quillaja saponaria]